MQSPVALANRQVPFATACRWAGVEVPGDVTERGLKIYCPFGEYSHSDGGAEMAFRVFPDHGYCFACAQAFSPVKICAVTWDCTFEEAARQMLDLAGIADPDYREQWRRLTDWSQPPDVDALASALRAWCSGTSTQWRVRQYDSGVAVKLAACLGLLSRVRTQEDCRAWLAGCKKAMAQVLTEGERDAGNGQG